MAGLLQEWVGSAALRVGTWENLSLPAQSDPSKPGMLPGMNCASLAVPGWSHCSDLAVGAGQGIPQGFLVGRRKARRAQVGRTSRASSSWVTSPGYLSPPLAPSHPPEPLPVEIKELGQPQPVWALLLGLLCVRWDAGQHFPVREPFKELSGSEGGEGRELRGALCFSAASGHVQCEFSVLINLGAAQGCSAFVWRELGRGSGSSEFVRKVLDCCSWHCSAGFPGKTGNSSHSVLHSCRLFPSLLCSLPKAEAGLCSSGWDACMGWTGWESCPWGRMEQRMIR